MFLRTVFFAAVLAAPAAASAQDCPFFDTDPDFTKLRVGIFGLELRSFDPMLRTSSSDRVILKNLHASLTDLAGGHGPGWTSEDAVVRVNDRSWIDGKEVLKLEIRQGLVFRNGREATTQDVAKTIEWALSQVGAAEGLEFQHVTDSLLNVASRNGFPVDVEKQIFAPPFGFVLPHDYARPHRSGLSNYEPPAEQYQLGASLGRYSTDGQAFSRHFDLTCVWSDTPTFPEASFTFFDSVQRLWNALEADDVDVIGPFTSPTQVSARLDIAMSGRPELSASVHKIARQYVLQPATRDGGQPSSEERATDRAVQETARGLVIPEQMQDFMEPATGPLPLVLMGQAPPAPTLPNASPLEARDRAVEALGGTHPLEVEVVFWDSDELSEALAAALVEQLRGANISARATGLNPQEFWELARRPTHQSDSQLLYFVRTVTSASGSLQPILRQYVNLASTGGAPAPGTLGERAAGLLAAGNMELFEFWENAKELSFGTTIPLTDMSVMVIHPRNLLVPVTPDGSLGPLHLFRTLEQ